MFDKFLDGLRILVGPLVGSDSTGIFALVLWILVVVISISRWERMPSFSDMLIVLGIYFAFLLYVGIHVLVGYYFGFGYGILTFFLMPLALFVLGLLLVSSQNESKIEYHSPPYRSSLGPGKIIRIFSPLDESSYIEGVIKEVIPTDVTDRVVFMCTDNNSEYYGEDLTWDILHVNGILLRPTVQILMNPS